MPREHDEQIRQRAYEIWEREGRPEGREEEHWRLARDEIAREHGAQEVPASRVSGPDKQGDDPPPSRPEAMVDPIGLAQGKHATDAAQAGRKRGSPRRAKAAEPLANGGEPRSSDRSR